MQCPTLDNWERAYRHLERDNRELVERAWEQLRAGVMGKVVAQSLGIPAQMVSVIKAQLDPKSDSAKRLAAWWEWRKWKTEQQQDVAARMTEARKWKQKMREEKARYFDPSEDYETFVKRMRGEQVHSKRIPLLDYEDAKEERLERLKDRVVPGLYRKTLRELLPLDKRAHILARLAESEDPHIALRAMQIIHRLEGVERKPKEGKSEPAQGPMFSLAGGVGVQVAPVGGDDGGGTKH